MIKHLIFFLIFVYPGLLIQAQDIQLPPPQKEGGMPLMEALSKRQTTRSFTEQTISIQTLSDLLWAAWGINRTESGKRTAPSANNKQNTELYCAFADGLYNYDAQNHSLKLVIKEDVRAATGTQEFVANAPLNLVYVAKGENAMNWTNAQKNAACVNAAFIAQNVYLFCASGGLGCVVRGLFDGEKLQQVLQLGNDKVAILTHTIGYPAN